MQLVVDWVWNGPWWAPLVGALYLSVLLGIALGPILGVRITRTRGGKGQGD